MRLQCTAQREGKLLSFLRRELALSSSLVKRLKFRGAYTVNGQRVFTDYPVRVGDRIEVCMDEDAPENYAPEAGELRILLEDEWLIALDKPPGVLMHPSSARNTGTLANFLLDYYQKTGQASAVHPVSRLDRDTFGVVLLAKSSHVHARFHAMQRAGIASEVAYGRNLYSYDGGYQAMQELLLQKADITAVFAMADVRAIGAIRALRDVGLRVPEDISVFGFDGLQIGSYFLPKLTTVHQSVELLADRAAKFLVENIEKGVRARHENVPFTMDLRESVIPAI